jgi:GNAT superfamily N-acetyltransferase
VSTPSMRALSAGEAMRLGGMTFPAYRHLLSLEPTARHTDLLPAPIVQPLALGAMEGDTCAGLLLAEMSGGASPSAEMLSLYVDPARRGQGVGTALVGALEREVGSRGVPVARAVYMTGKPGVAAVERILQKCGWAPPVCRAITVRFTPQEAERTPWFGRITLPAAFETVPWAEIGEDEKAEARASHEREPWIREGLEFWRHDAYGYDSLSSLGLRYHGRVVGWVINHRATPDLVRFTCSFMRMDLSRRGRIMPLYTESIRRLGASGCGMCSFVTPVHYAEMVNFVMRRCADVVSFVGETRGSEKSLVAAAAAVTGGRV